MARTETVEMLNPSRGTPDGGGGGTVRFPKRSAGESLRVAYVDNIKPNTAVLLDMIDQRLQATFKLESNAYRKEYGAGPARPGTYEEIARTADVAVVGVAD